MPHVFVKYKFSAKEEKNPTKQGAISVTFTKKAPTETEILAYIKKNHPTQKNIVINEIIKR